MIPSTADSRVDRGKELGTSPGVERAAHQVVKRALDCTGRAASAATLIARNIVIAASLNFKF
jgi:hypothetical protein